MNNFEKVSIFFDNILTFLAQPSSIDNDIQNLVKLAYRYALSKGILFLSSKHENMLEPISTVLLPIPLPQNIYNHGKKLSNLYNVLYSEISEDFDFLQKTLKNVVEQDPFIRRLWDIYEEARANGHPHDIQLSINRNDFMLLTSETGKIELKQVELNTIAAGMASLSQSAADVHKFVTEQLKLDPNAIPKESISSRLAEAIFCAHELYSQHHEIQFIPMIAIVVNVVENNIVDQTLLELDILSKVGTECLVRRLTLDYIGENAEIDSEGRLLLHGEFEVTIVYYRTAYSPQLMSSNSHWKGRRLVEISRCVKCPSISYQLSGCKKVQQALAARDTLSGYSMSESGLEMLFASMVGQYSLDRDISGDQMAQIAIQSPDKFVMKPQREGGGNNLFGESLVARLKELRNNAERSQYILMDRIVSKPTKNVILTDQDNPVVVDVVSEISFYGFVVSKGKEIVLNDTCGSFVRTKYVDCNEGGIVIRMSFFSSLFLTDSE